MMLREWLTYQLKHKNKTNKLINKTKIKITQINTSTQTNKNYKQKKKIQTTSNKNGENTFFQLIFPRKGDYKCIFSQSVIDVVVVCLFVFKRTEKSRQLGVGKQASQRNDHQSGYSSVGLLLEFDCQKCIYQQQYLQTQHDKTCNGTSDENHCALSKNKKTKQNKQRQKKKRHDVSSR